MNCLACVHWNLRESPLRAYGYGLCKADTNPMTSKGHTLNGQNVCRMGKFKQAPSETVARREKVLG